MLNAGIPLHETLEVLNDQIASPSLQYVLGVALADLADGLPLHNSIAKFPKLFDTFFTNALAVGESSGTLSSTMEYLATQLEKSEELHGKVRSALIYPLIVFFGAVGIAIYLAFFLLPKILPLFLSLNVKLPATTRALLASSTWLSTRWPWAMLAILLTILGAWLLLRIAKIRYAMSTFFLYLPIFGTLIKNIQMAKFSRILGTLLSSGVTIVAALQITAESTDHPVYKRALEKIARSMEGGETVSSVLHIHPKLFSRTAVSMIGIGERTGKLSESLLSLAQFTEREIDVTTQNLSILIEPITLLLVGLLVGFVALSIITPIYEITQGIHA